MNVWGGRILFDYVMLKTPIRCPNKDVKTGSYAILNLK